MSKRPLATATTTPKRPRLAPEIIDVDASPEPTIPELVLDPLLLKPSQRPWTGSDAPYAFLVHVLASLSATRSRIAILAILTNALRYIIAHHPKSLLPALYLLSNSLTPPYVSIELGLGPSIISKAIQHTSGLSPAALKRLYIAAGDPGDVAFQAKSNLRTLFPHPPLLITSVYDSLLKIASSSGQGATKQKQAIVEKLLVAAKGEESRYLVRTLCQNLRVGAVRTSLLVALARALVLTPPSSARLQTGNEVSPYVISPEILQKVVPLPDNKKKAPLDPARVAIVEKLTAAESLLKKVYVSHPNYDDIVSMVLEFGLDHLDELVPFAVGIPLLPTLGIPCRSLEEVYERLQDHPFTAEFKYDGQRAQIHAIKGDKITVKLFSRHLEDMTDKYPDIQSLMTIILNESSEITSFVLDAEIVAIDPKDSSLRSFQELSGRARKDVQLQDIKIPVCVFAFDLMYFNGKPLLQVPFRTRREMMRNHFCPTTPEDNGVARFAHVESCESEQGAENVEQFWRRAVEGQSEGLMIKLLDTAEIYEDDNDGSKGKARRKPLPATYEPDKRTSAWLKLKKDYVKGIGDTLDLVPIGAWHGNGRKAQWWSPILLALWDESAEEFIAVCKCMSGFSDEFYKALRDRYQEGSETCSKSPRWNTHSGGLKPEVYFKPQEVWEIRGADVTLSPVSVAAQGIVSSEKGLSLRFPRFVRVREDKGVDGASTPEFLAQMWRNQNGKGKGVPAADDGELIDVVALSASAGEEDDDD